MKVLITLFAIFLVCAQAYVKPAPSIDRLVEMGKNGATKTLSDKTRFRGSTYEVAVTEVKSMKYERAISMYTFEVTLTNGAINQECNFEWRFKEEGGEIYLSEIKVTTWRCQLLEKEITSGDPLYQWTRVSRY